jgi:hypothetical protein
MRTLNGSVLSLAVVVAVATVLPYTGIIPPRSTYSLIVGTALLLASYLECGFVLFLAVRLSRSPHTRTPRNYLCLLIGCLAAIPAIWLTPSFV